MRTKTWVGEKPEWSACGPKHVLSGKVNLTGLHVDNRISGFVYNREPSSHYFNFFLLHCNCGTNLAKIYQKLVQNGGNRAETQNNQKIIYLNEYLLDSSEMKGES